MNPLPSSIVMERHDASNISLAISECDHQIKKLMKLHEKLSAKKQQLSLHGAAKLLKGYESILQCSQDLLTQEAQLFEVLENSNPPKNTVISELINTENLVEPETVSFTSQVERHSGRKEIVGDDSDFIEDVVFESGPEVDSRERLFSPETSSILEEEVVDISHVESPTKRIKTSEIPLMEKRDPAVKKSENFSDLFVGSELAAFCRINGEKKSGEWILARFLKKIDIDLIEVEDAEDAQPEESFRRTKKSPRLKYSVNSSQIIKFDSKLADSLKPRDRIFALFPGTTCFYPATVVNSNQKRRKNEIVVRFSDDSAASRIVPSKYIFRCNTVNPKQ